MADSIHHISNDNTMILGIDLHIESNVIDVAYLRLTETAHNQHSVLQTV